MSVFSFSVLHAILLFCISSPIVSTANFLGNETDKLALLAFKSQTQDPFMVMSSWNDSNPLCEWEGVQCSPRHERVTALTLRGKGLMGILSPHIGNLSFLRKLVLENNSFQGEIPSDIGKLFRLEYLVLSNNSLVGEIPASISLCSNLRSLFLSSNNLAGKIPMGLGSLSKLVTFTLEVNKLEGSIPPSLGNLTSLKVLHLSRNSLVGSIPSTLDQLKSIMNLALESNKLSGEIPPSLYNLSTLVTFSVEDNQLTGNLPDDIGLSLPNLQRFLVGMNQFSGPIPASLFNVSGLSVLDIGINHFSGKVPLNIGNLKGLRLLAMGQSNLGSGKPGDLDFLTSLTNCSNLQGFSIAINQFGGTLPVSIANFSKQLTTMYIGQNQISGNIPNEIGNIRSLVDLDLSSNLFTGSIPTNVGDLQNLEELDLNSNQLSGRIPSSLRNLSLLFHLDLHNNSIEGDIALSLRNQKMQILDLSYNNFSGTILEPKISLSLQLLYLNLGHNSLSGSIPLEVGKLKNLGYLDVSENKMSAEVPVTLGSCDSLEYLFLQYNFLQGALPFSLGSLKGLRVLDISGNNITGEIPKELEKLSVLQSLNLSFNNLDGEVPITGIFGNATAISIVGNNKLCGGIPELKLPKCKIQKSKKHEISFALKISLGVLITSSFTVAMFLTIYYLRKKPKAKGATEQYMVDLRRVTYNDLHKATGGFSSENLIGMGSHGYVYKGILPPDEGPIAVKVLNLTEHKASKGFLAECEALRVIRHRNLLKILTVCSSVDSRGNDFKALVFEFMQNGSLESWLHPSSNGQDLPRSLNLNQRLNLAIDVACALDYLHNHCEESIVHCDLKSSNVLLADDMTARVCDFGLAKFISKSHSTSTNDSKSIGIRGTIGYIPPEYGMGVDVSTQGDVYSVGVLLLEMFTGKRPTDDMFNDGLSLHVFCKMALPDRVLDIMDMLLLSEEDANSLNRMKECVSSVMRIGVACSEELMIDRMDIQDVLRELHSIKEVFLSGWSN